MKKPLLLAGVGAIVGLGALTGVASAHNITPARDDMLAAKIAERFNLDKQEVQKTINEVQAGRHAKAEQKLAKQLDKAVADGKITAEQKDAILAKYAELQTFMESIKDKPAKERKQLMEEKRKELQQWAKDNGLERYVRVLVREHAKKSVQTQTAPAQTTPAPQQ